MEGVTLLAVFDKIPILLTKITMNFSQGGLYQVVEAYDDENGGEGAAHAGAVERTVRIHLGGAQGGGHGGRARVGGVHKWDDKHCRSAAVM